MSGERDFISVNNSRNSSPQAATADGEYCLTSLRRQSRTGKVLVILNRVSFSERQRESGAQALRRRGVDYLGEKDYNGDVVFLREVVACEFRSLCLVDE